MNKFLQVLTFTFLILVLLPFAVFSQDFCNGNFDYDQDVDGTDAAIFKADFGRMEYDRPCPPDGPAPVPQSGQTVSYTSSDDGALEKGIMHPEPRFKDNNDGTITDNLTGLLWLKNADCFGSRTWHEALSDSNGLSSGECGLTDGSNVGDWRLPNRFELESLLDLNNWMPAIVLPSPFQLVQWYPYWTSTNRAGTDHSWCINLDSGEIDATPRSHYWHVWPVRGGH